MGHYFTPKLGIQRGGGGVDFLYVYISHFFFIFLHTSRLQQLSHMESIQPKVFYTTDVAPPRPPSRILRVISVLPEMLRAKLQLYRCPVCFLVSEDGIAS